jgi:hypothetical protein
MTVADNVNPPRIPLVYAGDPQVPDRLLELTYGIEEQGLFGELFQITPDMDFQKELWNICLASRFSVAIGVDRDDVVFISKSTGPDYRIFHCRTDSFTRDSARKLGGNAARYIKCKPFV